MSNRQIQPANRGDTRLAPRGRPRGLVSQVSTSILQPGYFFRTLPPMADTRQWLWVAVLILALTGMSAVRQEGLKNGGSSGGFTAPPVDFSSPPTDGSGGGDGGLFGGPPPDFGGAPTDPTGGGGGAATGNISDNLTTALINGAGILLGWVVLAVLLCEVSLFNGQMPSFGQNLQVAIWTSVPIAVMAGIQLIYFAGSGPLREPGISGLLQYWKGYETLSSFLQSLVLSFTTQLTIFWIWSLVLIYVGGRNALQGKRWAVMIVVIAWAVLTVVAPVITGAIAVPETPGEDTFTDEFGSPGTGEDLPFDMGLEDPSGNLAPVMPDSTLPPELQFLEEQPTQPASNTSPEQTAEAGAAGEASPNAETFILGPSFGDVTAEATAEVEATPVSSRP